MKIKANLNLLYKIFIILLITMYMFESTTISNFNDSIFHDFIQYSALVIAFIDIIIRNYSIKELLRMFIIMIIGFLCYISSGNSGLLMTMLAILLMPKNYLDNILQMIFRTELILFFIIVILSLFGVIDNDILEISKGTYITEGISLGFSHPNMLAAQGTSIVLLYLCVNRNKLKIKHYIISIVCTIMLFICSKGRISLFLGLISVIMIAFTNNKYFKKKVLDFLPFVYLIVCIFIILCMVFYSRDYGTSRLTAFINDGLFNGRIGLAYRSLMVYPITLFGKAIDLSIWNQYQYFALDNGQAMILLEFGICGFLVYFYIIQTTLNVIKREKEIIFGIVLSVFLIWSMYEGTMYFIGKNFALLFLGTKNISLIINSKRKGGKV